MLPNYWNSLNVPFQDADGMSSENIFPSRVRSVWKNSGKLEMGVWNLERGGGDAFSEFSCRTAWDQEKPHVPYEI